MKNYLVLFVWMRPAWWCAMSRKRLPMAQIDNNQFLDYPFLKDRVKLNTKTWRHSHELASSVEEIVKAILHTNPFQRSVLMNSQKIFAKRPVDICKTRHEYSLDIHFFNYVWSYKCISRCEPLIGRSFWWMCMSGFPCPRCVVRPTGKLGKRWFGLLLVLAGSEDSQLYQCC